MRGRLPIPVLREIARELAIVSPYDARTILSNIAQPSFLEAFTHDPDQVKRAAEIATGLAAELAIALPTVFGLLTKLAAPTEFAQAARSEPPREE